MKTQKQGFVFKSSYYMNKIQQNITENIKYNRTKYLLQHLGTLLALLFITIRIDNIYFDDGSQQSLRVFSSRSRMSLL